MHASSAPRARDDEPLAPHVTQQKKREPNYGTTDLSFAFELRGEGPLATVKAARDSFGFHFHFQPRDGGRSSRLLMSQSQERCQAGSSSSSRQEEERPGSFDWGCNGAKILTQNFDSESCETEIYNINKNAKHSEFLEGSA